MDVSNLGSVEDVVQHVEWHFSETAKSVCRVAWASGGLDNGCISRLIVLRDVSTPQNQTTSSIISPLCR